MQSALISGLKEISANQTHSKNLTTTTKKPGSLASRILLHLKNHTTLQTSAQVTTQTKMASPVSTAKIKVTTRTTADPASQMNTPCIVNSGKTYSPKKVNKVTNESTINNITHSGFH